MRRISFALALIGLLTVGVAPVAAAHVSNDLPRGAITVPDALPQPISKDTTKAGVSSKDDFGCGAGGLDQATVWYKFTPTSDKDVLVDANASSYFVGVNIFEGTADANHLINCAGGAAEFFAAAGTTYYVMFADADGDATNGGTLNATFELAPPPIGVTLIVDPLANVSHSGVVTVTGTLTCSEPADFAEVDLFLRQTVGRFVIQGFGFAEATCGTDPTPWTADVSGDTGVFGGGSIQAQVSAFACNSTSCGDAFIEQALKLHH